jgi:CRP-like cAMP-binding protein
MATSIPAAFGDAITPEEWSSILALGEDVSFAPGEVLIAQGERPDALLLLEDGRADVVAVRGGQRSVVANFAAGDLAGEMSLITDQPASASVVATVAVRARQIPRRKIERQSRLDPALGDRLFSGLARLMAARLSASGRSGVRGPSLGRLATACASVMPTIPSVVFSPDVESMIARYEEVGHRPRFLWCWCARGVEKVTFSTVPQSLRDELRDTKMLAIILNVLLDDIADKRGDLALLEAALDMLTLPAKPLPPVAEGDRAYVQLIADLWSLMANRVRPLAGWEEWRNLYIYDWRQVFNAMRYGLLVHHHPALVNRAELGTYKPHNMNMMVFATIDIMASPAAVEELGLIREAMLRAQTMGQIGNDLATWRREVPDRDFTNWLLAAARRERVISVEQLKHDPPEQIVDRVEKSKLEERVLEDWHAERRRLEELAPLVQSVDLETLRQGSDVLLGMSLAAAGRL